MSRFSPFLPITVLSLTISFIPAKTHGSPLHRMLERCASFLERHKVIPVFGRNIPRDLSSDEFWTHDPGFLVSFNKWSGVTPGRWRGVRYAPGTKNPSLSVEIDLHSRYLDIQLHWDHGILPNIRKVAWSLAEARGRYEFHQIPRVRITRDNHVIVRNLEFSPSAIYFTRILIEVRELNSFNKPLKLAPEDVSFLCEWYMSHLNQDELVWQTAIRFDEIVDVLNP